MHHDMDLELEETVSKMNEHQNFKNIYILSQLVNMYISIILHKFSLIDIAILHKGPYLILNTPLSRHLQ